MRNLAKPFSWLCLKIDLVKLLQSWICLCERAHLKSNKAWKKSKISWLKAFEEATGQAQASPA